MSQQRSSRSVTPNRPMRRHGSAPSPGSRGDRRISEVSPYFPSLFARGPNCFDVVATKRDREYCFGKERQRRQEKQSRVTGPQSWDPCRSHFRRIAWRRKSGSSRDRGHRGYRRSRVKAAGRTNNARIDAWRCMQLWVICRGLRVDAPYWRASALFRLVSLSALPIPVVAAERILPMTFVQLLDVRVERSGSMRDVCTAYGSAPSAEDLARWENDGGAPASKRIVDASNEPRACDSSMFPRGGWTTPSLHVYVVSEPP